MLSFSFSIRFRIVKWEVLILTILSLSGPYITGHPQEYGNIGPVAVQKQQKAGNFLFHTGRYIFVWFLIFGQVLLGKLGAFLTAADI